MRAPWLLTLPPLALALACATADDAPSVADDHVVAELERPTDDGLARYVFRFVEDDGAIATLIGTPAGYPAPVDDGCALDTFLRVAPDDAVVPPALLRACRDVDDARPRRVADLRTPALTFEVRPLAAAAGGGPFCTDASYATRFGKMVDAAKTQATIYDVHLVCELLAYRDLESGTCSLSVPETGESGFCDFAEITAECGVVNPCCLQSRPEGAWIANPACAHDVIAWSSPLPWLDWEGDTGDGASKLQAEVSACDPSSTTVVFWQKKNSPSEPWGQVHQSVLAGSYWWVLKLDSGTSNGAYRGARYRVHANGNGVRPTLVAAKMQGIDRTACPIPFPL